ncbi:MAG: GNAT family N-acetyltransferase [Alphaproteobacteria bacterium]
MSPSGTSSGGLLGRLFGGGDQAASDGPFVRPMTPGDLAAALAIIEDHDEDDAEEAEESLRERDCAGMLVVEEAGDILGLTGAVVDEDVPDIRWLSWTYVRRDARSRGIGSLMIGELLRILDEDGVRKLFIATSDYQEDGEDLYADAIAFYTDLGAREELRVPDYHDAGEAKIILSLINENAPADEPLTAETAGLSFDDIAEAPESEDGFGLVWHEAEDGVNGLEAQLSRAQEEDARAIFVELPEDLSHLAATALTEAGFSKAGALSDYYGPGADQVHWVKTLKA